MLFKLIWRYLFCPFYFHYNTTPFYLSFIMTGGQRGCLYWVEDKYHQQVASGSFTFCKGTVFLKASKCCKKQNLSETFWTMTVGAKVVPNGVKAPNWKSLYTSFIVPGDPRPHSAGQDAAASYNFYIKPSFSITVIKVRDLSYFMFGSCTHKYVRQCHPIKTRWWTKSKFGIIE